jgi:hypothetical protein
MAALSAPAAVVAPVEAEAPVAPAPANPVPANPVPDMLEGDTDA